jgi:DNA polymerase-1
MLLWPEQQTTSKGKRFRPNPIPRIPNTGWKMRNHFPDLSGAKVICFDVETKDPNIETKGPGWGRGDGHIIGLAVATDDGFKQYYPMRHEGYENHNPHDVMDWARIQLGRDSQPKLGHNIIYDIGWLEHEGVAVKGEINDTWTAARLIDHGSSAALEEQGQAYLGEGKESTELYEWQWQSFGQRKPKSKKDLRVNAMANLYRCPPALVGFYGESDVELPIRLFREQFQELQELGLWDVYRMECDLIPILVQMRLLGVSVDLDAAERARDHILDAANQLQKEVNKIAGRPVNTGSPVEMEKVFSRLKIPFNRTKNGKMSLTGAFLQTVQHPIGQMIVDLEELKKYNSTFIENAILGSNVNGKVHGQFNPLRAVTGRMSASNPNLQQVPSRNELAKMVRAIFIPDKGHHHWRKYDYSSIESRILAHFAVGQGSKDLRKEYKNNPDTDYHNFTQAMIKRLVGLELPRKHVKNVNFAGIYGASEKKLQSMMGLSNEEAEEFFEAYHSGLPYVRATMKHMSDYAETHGYTRTIMGRRALFDKWEPKYSPKGSERAFPLKFEEAVAAYGPNIKRSHLHKGLNYTIQGSAADLMKAAIVKCHKDGIYAEIGYPRLIVHDEKDFSVSDNWNEEAFTEMKHIMETAITFKIPIRVEGEWGPNWSQLYKL